MDRASIEVSSGRHDATKPATPRPLYARVRKDIGALVLDVEMELSAGITILFGASGAGKTTLLNCLAGLLRPDGGRIVFGERVLFDSAAPVDIRTERRRAGYLFQDLALFPHLTAQENVEYGLSQFGHGERRKVASEALRTFRADHVAKRKPPQLSGGERQRVALARALAPQPDFLLLDEPLTGLDAATKRALIDDLRGWNALQQIPILYVTHARDEAYALGERVIVMEQGRIVAEGTPHEVLETPMQESVAQLAGFENVLEARVAQLNPLQGTMTCELLPRLEDAATVLGDIFAEAAAHSHIEAPYTGAKSGARLRIGIRAGDILIATEPPRQISARNVMIARIESLERRGSLFIANTALQGTRPAVRIEVHLTPGAVDSLSLGEGSTVWLVIKTHSCRVWEPQS